MISFILGWLISLYMLVLFVFAVMSWFPIAADSTAGQIQRLLGTIIEPALRPLRRVLPPVDTGGMSIDIAFLALFGILLLAQFLVSFLPF